MTNWFGHRLGHGQVDALALPLYVRDLWPICTTRDVKWPLRLALLFLM